MSCRPKSQSFYKSGSGSVSFGQPQRVMDFRPDVGQLLINPAPKKKAGVYRCFGCGKAGHFIKDCKVQVFNKRLCDSDLDQFSDCGQVELNASVSSVFWIRGLLVYEGFCVFGVLSGPPPGFLVLSKTVTSFPLFLLLSSTS